MSCADSQGLVHPLAIHTRLTHTVLCIMSHPHIGGSGENAQPNAADLRYKSDSGSESSSNSDSNDGGQELQNKTGVPGQPAAAGAAGATGAAGAAGAGGSAGAAAAAQTQGAAAVHHPQAAR